VVSFDRSRLNRSVLILGLAWGPAVLGLFLGRSSGLFGVALGLALLGLAAAIALAAWSARVRRARALRADPGPTDGDDAWDRIADPRGNYANRWAMYQNLSAWLRVRDWAGKSVAEFGQTNEVLRSFMPGAHHVVLEYPRHDLQHLDDVPADRFDLAILDQTLEHVPDPEQALAEVRRVLKSGGVAIVTTPFLVPVHGTESYGDFTRWTPQGLAALLQRCGFQPDVHSWGSLSTARELLGAMHLTADEAMSRKVPIGQSESEPRFPVTVWAVATVAK